MDIFFIADAVLILILVFSVLNGYMRGLIITASNLIGMLASWFIGRWVASAFAARFSESFLDPLIGQFMPDSDTQGLEAIIEEAADSAISSLTENISYFILFIITAFAIYALVGIIGRVVDRIFELPILSIINKIGGVAAGFVTGVVTLFAIGAVCAWVCGIVSEFLMMPEIYEYIDKIKILKYLTEHNPFLG